MRINGIWQDVASKGILLTEMRIIRFEEDFGDSETLDRVKTQVWKIFHNVIPVGHNLKGRVY